MIKFKKQDNVIPIDFEDFQLEFTANDDNLAKMMELGEELNRSSAKFSDNPSDVESIQQLKELVKYSWDTLFNEGTFDKVYEFTNQSILYALTCLLDTISGISEVYNRQSTNSALSKYLNDGSIE
ncbi:hypothetical protein ACWOBX_08325 [Facklamia languida]